MSIKLKMVKAGHTIAKHSPAIYTSVGIVGLGATAYLAYKSRDKVEVVVESIETARDNDQEIDYPKVGADLIKALYIPITVGVVSVASIFMSHRVSRNRILALSGALAAQQSQNLYMKTKYRETHGDKKFEEFMTPTEQVEVESETKDGKKKISKSQIKKNMDDTVGAWYNESEHSVRGDHTYNLAYIDSVAERMQLRLFQRGTLTLNEVREALGLGRIPSGALLGWTAADFFEITKTTTNIGDIANDEDLEQIWVAWSTAKFVYNDIEFDGRYSI